MAISNSIRLLALLWFVAFGAIAGEGDESGASTLTIRPWTYERIEQFEKLLEKSQYNQAIQLLKKMQPEVTDVPYEEAIVLRSFAQTYALKDDYKTAANYLKRCLAMNALPPKQEHHARYNLAQLYIGSKQYKDSIKILEQIIAKGAKLEPDAYIMLGSAYAQLKQYSKAVKPVKKAVGMTRKPRESWLQLLFGLHFQLKNYPASAAVLRDLIQRWPDKKDYWLQLAAIEQLRKRYQSALAIQELAYKKGFISTETELLGLVSLYLHKDVPNRAARTLAQEMDAENINNSRKNWELLANAWARSKDYDDAINALQKVATLSKNGKADLQLARLYMEKENWAKVSQFARRALKKGGIAVGEAWLFIGIANLENEKLENALQAFTKAKKYTATAKPASDWLTYVNTLQAQTL